MKLWLVRHGETAFTHERRYCGQQDPALSTAGEAQARALRAVLPHDIEQVFSSDLQRARQTALLALGQEPALLPELRELHFGDFEGLTSEQCAARNPSAYDAFLSAPWDCAPPNGETFTALQKRCARVLETVREAGGKNVALFTHGGTIKALLLLCLDLPVQKLWQLEIHPGAASLVELWEAPSGATLRALNLGYRYS